jgi:hypothetical protein
VFVLASFGDGLDVHPLGVILIVSAAVKLA